MPVNLLFAAACLKKAIRLCTHGMYAALPSLQAIG
jgi:hypothetical protein